MPDTDDIITTRPAPEAAPATTDPQTEARNRAAACGRAIGAILTQHRCQIMPYLRPPTPVGNDGRQAIVTADYAIVPEP